MTTRACVPAIFVFILPVALLRTDWVKLTSDLVSDVLKLAFLVVLIALTETGATRVLLRVFIPQLVHLIRDVVLTQSVILLPPAAAVPLRRRATDYFDVQDSVGCNSEPYYFGLVANGLSYASWQRAGEKKQNEQQQGVLLLVSSRDGALRCIESFGCVGNSGVSLWEEEVISALHESHNTAAAGCGARSNACCGQQFGDGVKEGDLMACPAVASSLASAALPSPLEGNEEAGVPLGEPAGSSTPKVEACSNMVMVLRSGASALIAKHGPADAATAMPDSAEVSATMTVRVKRARRGRFMAPTASSRAVAAEGRSKKAKIVGKKQTFDSKRPRPVQEELAQMAASHKAMVKALHVLRSEYNRAGTSKEEVVAAMKTIGRASSLERKISKSFF